MITLLNAAPDTGNQGVSALCYSAIAGLRQRGQEQICVADHGRGRRKAQMAGAATDLIGLTHTRRFWRGDSLSTVAGMARFGASRLNPAAHAIVNSKAVVDVSGGDSFTDLYGARRFEAMVKTKELALDNGVPLILLPQTLGPFHSHDNLRIAVNILRRARAVWLRDQQSFDFLRHNLGADFDPEKHRLGVDMAVALPAEKPQLPPELAQVLPAGRGFALAGLNVSGLLCHNPILAQTRFGLANSHIAQIDRIAAAILHSDPHLRLLLVPHVHRALDHPESDLAAAYALRARMPAALASRVIVLQPCWDAMQLKWVLSQLDWFAGARMHATIGAFSSGTPTLGLGYSDKTAGVFAQCGIGDMAIDLRRADLDMLDAAVSQSLAMRARTRTTLASSLPALLARAAAQMDAIAQQIRG